ncbi:hypothetical protein GIB67_005803, partial [Kingdonia uniflora]
MTSQVLDGLNYGRWAQFVKFFVGGCENIGFLLNTEKERAESDLKYAKWFSDDSMVRTLLINFMQLTISAGELCKDCGEDSGVSVGFNPNFEYARVHLLDMTPFPTPEEAHIYCVSDQSRRSPMPPIFGIPSEIFIMVVCYAYPVQPSIPSMTSSPILSPLPVASDNSRPLRKKCDYC